MPSLQLDDFAHIAGMKEMMLTYLQKALKHHQKGVNLLIYGVPGTGKTEFAGLLAQALGISAYNITYMDSDGDVVEAGNAWTTVVLLKRYWTASRRF